MTRPSLPLATLALLTSLSCAGPQADPAPIVRGPLPSRNQHPFGLTLMHPRARRPVTQAEGTLGVALDVVHNSIFEVDKAPAERVRLDGEVTRAAARLRYGVGERTDLEVQVAAIYASSGFLDNIIQQFHDLTGLPNQGRGFAEQDKYRMELRRNGKLLWRLEEDRVSFADVPLVLTHQVRVEDEAGPAVAVRGGFELPTGSENRGAGNGGMDYAVGAFLERSLGRWTVFGGLDVMLPAEPDKFVNAGVKLKDMAAVGVGGEYRWSDRTSLLAHLMLITPMTRDFTLEEFDREILDLAIGAAWDLPGGGVVHAAFEEDVIAATGPDFGVMVGVRWGW